MQRLVFETELGHVALARQAEPSGLVSAGLASAGSASVGSASKGHWGRLYALVFGHASEQAALKGLARTLDRDALAGGWPYWASQADYVYPGCDELVDRLCAFAVGEEVCFDDLQIDVRHLTPFGQRVIAACRKISWGETLTYGELAKRAGRPGAARAVGSVMARNLLPLIVPCHRVIPASGGLGGFSAPQGVAMKRRLLEMEHHGTASQLVTPRNLATSATKRKNCPTDAKQHSR